MFRLRNCLGLPTFSLFIQRRRHSWTSVTLLLAIRQSSQAVKAPAKSALFNYSEAPMPGRVSDHQRERSEEADASDRISLDEKEKQEAYAREVWAGVESVFRDDTLTVDHVIAVCLSSLRPKLEAYLGVDARLMGQPSNSWSEAEFAILQEACYEVLTNDAPLAADYEATQDFGPYGVYVRGVPGIYFIDAIERERCGPFATLDLAADVAALNYSDLITRGLEMGDSDDEIEN